LDKGDAKGEKTVGEWTYNWDDTTASPFLFDAGRQLFITYDNPASMKAKAKWAKDQGLRGIKLYPVTGDQDGQLIKAIKEGWAS
jgi:chitinase